MNDVKPAIVEYIQREFLQDRPDTELSDADPLIENGIVDSLGIFLLVAFLEEQCDVTIDPQDVVLKNFETVDAIVQLVESKRAAGAAS